MVPKYNFHYLQVICWTVLRKWHFQMTFLISVREKSRSWRQSSAGFQPSLIRAVFLDDN